MKGFLNFITGTLFIVLTQPLLAQPYPQDYFRHPLNIPMQLVANFGELRTNHWHMGLDIRTQQRVNVPVYAAAEGYIARIKIEPWGFGRAIYINHPNGLTTLYAHLNDFFPALEQYVKEQQYRQQSWQIDLEFPPTLFPVKQSDFIAYSGTTGGSQGPHVHFEVRDTKTENCLNPLLFNFPIPDAVPPSLYRLAMYDRSKSVYSQTPKILALQKAGSGYKLAGSNLIKTGNNKISFAIGAVDRFTGYTNPNGIYSGKVLCDDVLESEFVLNNISYNETRYLNAQIDYQYKKQGGPYVQHLSRMPGDTSNIYKQSATEGIMYLTDTAVHDVRIEIKDAAQNVSVLQFKVQYKPDLAKAPAANATQQLVPGQVNVFETNGFEVFTSEYAVYDTVNTAYKTTAPASGNAISPLHVFCSAAIPVHDSVIVRIKPTIAIAPEDRNKVIIKSMAGSRTEVAKAHWQGDWVYAKFRQLGIFQAFVDAAAPTVNAPGAGPVVNLQKVSRLVFTPKDNFKEINSFRAEVDGQWLRFTNDKGASYIYKFDEKFPTGTHQLTVSIEDMAGNLTTKTWTVKR